MECCCRSARARGLAVVRPPCRTRAVPRPHPAAAAAAAGAPQARRPYLSREECELLDLQRQMEEEMVEEYKQVGRPPSLLVPPRGGAWLGSATGRTAAPQTPRSTAPRCTAALNPAQAERVIGERHWADGTVKYLVKWRGLPYCEATYEAKESLEGVGLGQHVTDFQVGGRPAQRSGAGDTRRAAACGRRRKQGAGHGRHPGAAPARRPPATPPLAACVPALRRSASAASWPPPRPWRRSARRLRPPARAPSRSSPTT